MTDSQLLDEAAIIKNEYNSGANTAERVGQMFEDIINNKVGNYKSYIALLSQSNEDAPTQIVLENTLGYNINWNYETDGYYTTSETFNQELTFVSITNNSFNDQTRTYGAGIFGSVAPITIYSGDANNSLNNTPIEIRVYE
jgi:hypothetical protein